MGRIKSKLVKRASHTLLKGNNVFTEKFNENKVVLGNSMPSKKIRNQMAGYISRLKKRELKTK
jgi:ribosomal protein S17E